MYYSCKVLKPEFKKKLDAQIEIEIKDALERRKVPTDRKTFAAEFERTSIRDHFNFMWNHPNVGDTVPDMKKYYEDLGLWTPEYEIVTLKAVQYGFQSKPRVNWGGKDQKIDDIDEIFSYQELEAEPSSQS